MCVAGGRRCPGSHSPSAKQRARRKANSAYRKAVAAAIEDKTGDAELARRVKDAPLTDVADVVTAAGLDGEAIAKKCGQATYTDKDGHTTTVDVTPAGTTRRTPITEDAQSLLADVCEATEEYEPGPFADAVAAGDREAQEQLRAEADDYVANRLELFDNEEDLSRLSKERLERRIDQLADLDNWSQKKAGRSLDPETEAKVAALAERYENALNGKDEPEPAPQRPSPLEGLNNTYGFDEITEDNVEDVIAAANSDIENVELGTLTDDEFDEYYSKMDDLDDRVREVTGEEGIEGFVATVNDEWDYRSMDDDDKYEFCDEYRRASQIDRWAESTLNEGTTEGDSQSARGAYAAAQYLYQSGHAAQQGLDKDERDEYADDAVAWAASVLDDDEDRGAFERGIAETVVTQRKWDKIKDVQPSTLSDKEFEAHAERFKDVRDRIEDGQGNALSTHHDTQDDMSRMAKAIEADKERRATPPALRGIRDLYGYGEVTRENAEDVAYTANEDIENTDLTSMSDEEFEEYYDRMSTLDDEVRDAGGELHSFSTVHEEYEYRDNDEDDRYAYYDEHRQASQVNKWAMETAENTSHVPADNFERGKFQAAKYLQGRASMERFVDTDAVRWAHSVLDDEDGEFGAFEQGIARNVMGKHTMDSLQAADFSTMSEDEKEQAHEQINELLDNLEDYPILYTDYEATRRLGELYLKLNK